MRSGSVRTDLRCTLARPRPLCPASSIKRYGRGRFTHARHSHFVVLWRSPKGRPRQRWCRALCRAVCWTPCRYPPKAPKFVSPTVGGQTAPEHRETEPVYVRLSRHVPVGAFCPRTRHSPIVQVGFPAPSLIAAFVGPTLFVVALSLSCGAESRPAGNIHPIRTAQLEKTPGQTAAGGLTTASADRRSTPARCNRRTWFWWPSPPAPAWHCPMASKTGKWFAAPLWHAKRLVKCVVKRGRGRGPPTYAGQVGRVEGPPSASKVRHDHVRRASTGIHSTTRTPFVERLSCDRGASAVPSSSGCAP